MKRYPIKIGWAINENGMPWNDICAVIIENFGLPGDKYITELSDQAMTFNFKEPEDAMMAKLTIGDVSGCD